jgi:hypothetical protein
MQKKTGTPEVRKRKGSDTKRPGGPKLAKTSDKTNLEQTYELESEQLVQKLDDDDELEGKRSAKGTELMGSSHLVLRTILQRIEEISQTLRGLDGQVKDLDKQFESQVLEGLEQPKTNITTALQAVMHSVMNRQRESVQMEMELQGRINKLEQTVAILQKEQDAKQDAIFTGVPKERNDLEFPALHSSQHNRMPQSGSGNGDLGSDDAQTIYGSSINSWGYLPCTGQSMGEHRSEIPSTQDMSLQSQLSHSGDLTDNTMNTDVSALQQHVWYGLASPFMAGSWGLGPPSATPSMFGNESALHPLRPCLREFVPSAPDDNR